MFSFFKRIFANAVHKSGVEGLLDELPHCEPLCNMQVLSIGLESDQQRVAAIMKFMRNKTFDPINFLIRDEKNGKQTVMTADLIRSQRYRVQLQATGQKVMEVNLSN